MENWIPLFDKLPTANAELRCTSGDTSLVPAALASRTFQITVQDPVSYIESTEWNSTTVSKWCDLNRYNSETTAIWVLFTFDDNKKAHNNLRR